MPDLTLKQSVYLKHAADINFTATLGSTIRAGNY